MEKLNLDGMDIVFDDEEKLEQEVEQAETGQPEEPADETLAEQSEEQPVAETPAEQLEETSDESNPCESNPCEAETNPCAEEGQQNLFGEVKAAAKGNKAPAKNTKRPDGLQSNVSDDEFKKAAKKFIINSVHTVPIEKEDMYADKKTIWLKYIQPNFSEFRKDDIFPFITFNLGIEGDIAGDVYPGLKFGAKG